VTETRQRLVCDALAVGHGFTANIDLALALGCATRIAPDGGLAVMTGGDGRTSVPGVYAAGEITGVGGSTLAVVEGQLAGAGAASAAGAGAALSDRGLAVLRRRRGRLVAFAETMHRAHTAPDRWLDRLVDDTVVCRCEEVPAGAIRAAVTELGATDARSVKQLARPGMGWCQGRMCGEATAELTAAACGRPVRREDLLTFAARPLAAAVRLGDLAE
jgi:NAD(P)H-nitrite reductase large subunit